MVSYPIKSLLTGLVDYAGLFPPAQLSMDPAVAEFARQRRTKESWILARFVLPAVQLRGFEAAMKEHRRPEDEGIWGLSALARGDLEECRQLIDAFNERNEGLAAVESIEYKPEDIGDLIRAVKAFDGLEVFFELAYDRDTTPFLDAIARYGAKAKIRTGGIEPEAIPSIKEVAKFLLAADRAGVAFKATAGLHHPLRGDYRLTYEEDSPTGTMHGFLNLFLAAAWLKAEKLSRVELEEILSVQGESALEFTQAGVAWRHRKLSADCIADARRGFAMSYGSCSFQEPVDDLRKLRLL